jgi:hypothetical protein
MNLPEGTSLTYIVWHEAWYADASRTPGEHPHLMVSAAADEGGVAWEFQVDGYDLSGSPVTRVKMFEDAYAAFADMPEFFAALAEHRPVTLDEVQDILISLGATDTTPRVSPYPPRETTLRDRIIDRLGTLRRATPGEVADAVLSVLGSEPSED